MHGEPIFLDAFCKQQLRLIRHCVKLRHARELFGPPTDYGSLVFREGSFLSAVNNLHTRWK
jgi:hypothetical protein